MRRHNPDRIRARACRPRWLPHRYCDPSRACTPARTSSRPHLCARGSLARNERNRRIRRGGNEFQHELSVGLDQNTVVSNHDAPRSVQPGPQRAQRPVDIGYSLAKRGDAAANSAQRYPAIEQRQHRANGDEIAELELTVFATRISRIAGDSGLQQRSALPVPQPRARNPGNPRDIVERVGPHRGGEYIDPAATPSKIEPIGAGQLGRSAPTRCNHKRRFTPASRQRALESHKP